MDSFETVLPAAALVTFAEELPEHLWVVGQREGMQKLMPSLLIGSEVADTDDLAGARGLRNVARLLGAREFMVLWLSYYGICR